MACGESHGEEPVGIGVQPERREDLHAVNSRERQEKRGEDGAEDA